MAQIWVKRIFLIIPQKMMQKFWPKRKTSQPSFWTFLEHFLSQNLVLTCNISHLLRKQTLFLDEFLRNFMITKKRKKLVAMFYVLVRTFVLFFMGWRKESVLPIFETFLQKSFVKDQKYFRGTCCFSISENLLKIHLTYAENGLVKTDVFLGHLLIRAKTRASSAM